MSNYKVHVNVGDTKDNTTLEARSPIEAAFIAGVALGGALVVSDREIFGITAMMLGVGAVQHEIETSLRNTLNSVLVEEL